MEIDVARDVCLQIHDPPRSATVTGFRTFVLHASDLGALVSTVPAGLDHQWQDERASTVNSHVTDQPWWSVITGRITSSAGFAVASTRRAASAGSASTSCSHTRTAIQPRVTAVVLERASRSRLRCIFVCHRSAFGPDQDDLPWAGQLCQKQPSTNTAIRYLGRTKSGVQPGANLRCSLKRTPAACSAFLRRISGAVFVLTRPVRCPLLSVVTHRLELAWRCEFPITRRAYARSDGGVPYSMTLVR